jgi:selenocysteine-specific elongation factor
MAVLEQETCLEIKEIAARLGRPLKNVEAVLAALTKKDQAAVVSYEFASSRKALDKAHLALAKLWQTKREISPSDFKESLSVSRKYAMALLAYFDDRQITRRMGNSRVLLKAPKAN